ncbi:AmmeMemoRadiSam system radical SAM enzyme [Marinobacterium sediminicola]|uniref:Pyruvate formate lyase activating enzyme n=1 Tax=Marinobacterium sediminicola TaxID=518898 RepID=A0ABY1RVL1_9GAMM|nr:AmmeMemoRadiSam system radical SAM enzyme [Marinobacterium sediminicola]ULG70641.1 AmmeMemoRadiSam system radical SAM enzyme [Marinobacterium sediminicola]SMR68783.1 pyruvate formate lyase activating enzyme [Marinobacterium sediminicola]
MNTDHSSSTRYWHALENGKLQCDLCPRFCKLNDGQRGLCFVRGRVGNEIRLLSYGLSSGFCIDPIEKKPLNHFLPGTPVLSFGTAGCNLACRFCQNWDISRSRYTESLCDSASPEQLVRTAVAHDCRSIAFTYNDPVIFHEYAIDVAKACHQHGLNSVAVSAGYVCPAPREEFYRHMDAANIDLKAFSERFYKNICGGHLAPVLETLEYIYHQTNTWLEITTLLIPDENDTDREIAQLSRWIGEHLSDEVPVHFTAFHPDWKMMNHRPTPLDTLQRARMIAREEGLKYVYTGNLPDPEGNTTYCPECNSPLIKRSGYMILDWALTPQGKCGHCGHRIPGYFEPTPGHWGSRRLPVNISRQ